MENLPFDWRVGFGMKSLLGENYGGGPISQLWCFGDTSDATPVLASVAIGRINQTNPWVVRGVDSVPLIEFLDYKERNWLKK